MLFWENQSNRLSNKLTRLAMTRVNRDMCCLPPLAFLVKWPETIKGINIGVSVVSI
jgi:hypothetical protein